MVLNNQWITEEIKKYLETYENESMMTQNLWDRVKAVLRGKFIAIKSYLRKQQKSQIKQPNKQPNLTPKAARERRTDKTQN